MPSANRNVTYGHRLLSIQASNIPIGIEQGEQTKEESDLYCLANPGLWCNDRRGEVIYSIGEGKIDSRRGSTNYAPYGLFFLVLKHH